MTQINKNSSKRGNKKNELKKFRMGLTGNCKCTPQKDLRMKIINQDLDRDVRFQPDSFCLFLWENSMPDWIGDDLRDDLIDALRGFSEDMALEIADNAIDCWSGLGLHTTGIRHIDATLWRLYSKILDRAHVMGIKLEYR